QQDVYTAAGLPTSSFVQNPFIADFNARQPGAANDVGPGMALLTSSIYRPYLFGGHPQYGYGAAESRVQREQYEVAAGVKGEYAGDSVFGRMLDGVTYAYSGQFTRYDATNIENGDWLANRLQDALMGYGGPE